MSWPGMADYAAAVQSPVASFLIPELKSARVATNALGLPRVSSGNFAVVYEVASGGRIWAVRCFTREVGDLEARYTEIDRHLRRLTLPYFVGFTYASRGILINGQPYPLVKMEWVAGLRLAEYVAGNLGDPARLLSLAAQFGELSKQLEANQIGHGDVSADNVIVTANGIKLIDYDGMYVPSLAGRRSRELGNPDFQHPRRDQNLFGPAIDRFSILVVCLALAALASDPTLWKRLGAGNGLLFTAADLKDPDRSDLLRELLRASDPTLAALAQELKAWLRLPPDRSGPLPDVSRLRVTRVNSQVPGPGFPRRPTARSLSQFAIASLPVALFLYWLASPRKPQPLIDPSPLPHLASPWKPQPLIDPSPPHPGVATSDSGVPEVVQPGGPTARAAGTTEEQQSLRPRLVEYVTVARTAVRDAPRWDASILAWIPARRTIAVDDNDGEWLHIVARKRGSVGGFVARADTRIAEYVTSRRTPLREAPSRSAAIVGWIPSGKTVTASHIEDDWLYVVPAGAGRVSGYILVTEVKIRPLRR